jgi:hypothetical protein
MISDTVTIGVFGQYDLVMVQASSSDMVWTLNMAMMRVLVRYVVCWHCRQSARLLHSEPSVPDII